MININLFEYFDFYTLVIILIIGFNQKLKQEDWTLMKKTPEYYQKDLDQTSTFKSVNQLEQEAKAKEEIAKLKEELNKPLPTIKERQANVGAHKSSAKETSGLVDKPKPNKSRFSFCGDADATEKLPETRYKTIGKK